MPVIIDKTLGIELGRTDEEAKALIAKQPFRFANAAPPSTLIVGRTGPTPISRMDSRNRPRPVPPDEAA